jgi:glycosyltransferase involved in cell wall biosynthesis
MIVPSDVSVIIPYYNREEFIDEAVQSVLAQTLKPIEIIIVNDCSRESSRRYLDRYSDVCTILDLKENVGLSGSRNAGIRAARGQFIALLDDDDYWLPEKLELQRKYMEEHPECSALTCSVSAFFSDRPDQLWTRFGPGAITLAQALIEEYWAVPSSLMVRMTALLAVGGFDQRFRECEDRDFMIRFCAAGYRIEGIPKVLVRYRRTGQNSLSERRWRMFTVHIRIVWLHKALFYRVYGTRGMVNFLLGTLYKATNNTTYIHGVVKLIIRVVKLKWRVRSGYQEPVPCEVREHA